MNFSRVCLPRPRVDRGVQSSSAKAITHQRAVATAGKPAMAISVKHGAKSASLPLPPTLGALRSEVRELLQLPDGSLRLLCKGRAIEGDDDASPGLEEGAKLMVMFSAAVVIDAAASVAPERMRGFEDSDRIQRTGGVGGRGSAHTRAGGASSMRPSSRFGFDRTEALPAAQLAAGATPGLQAAQALLTRLSTDACILQLMERREWRVGLLTEMPPQACMHAYTCAPCIGMVLTERPPLCILIVWCACAGCIARRAA